MNTTPSTTCPKCAAAMEFGVLADRTHGSESTRGPERALEWLRGLPRKSWWSNAFVTPPGDRLPVATLRCTGCGYLELYAPPEPGAEVPASGER